METIIGDSRGKQLTWEENTGNAAARIGFVPVSTPPYEVWLLLVK